MSLREALEKLIQDNVVVDRRPRDKHGPIGRLPEAKVPTSVLRDLLAAHPEPATGCPQVEEREPHGPHQVATLEEGVWRECVGFKPTPAVTDEAILIAIKRCRSGGWDVPWAVMRAALEAAQPYMGVRPVVGRAAVERAHEFLQKWDNGSVIAWAGGRSLRYEDLATLLGSRQRD